MFERASEIAVAFLINVAAAAVFYLATESLAAALAALVVAEAAVVVWLAAKPRIRAVGVVALNTSTPEEKALVALAEAASTELSFWGISAKTLLSNDTFNSLMIRKARGACRFRFLILSPESSAVAAKALEEGDTPEGWAKEIEANVVRLKALRDQHHLNLELRMYDQYPTWRCWFVNSDLLFLGWYPPGEQGRHSPFLRIRNTKSSIYHPVRADFETLWKESTVVL